MINTSSSTFSFSQRGDVIFKMRLMDYQSLTYELSPTLFFLMEAIFDSRLNSALKQSCCLVKKTKTLVWQSVLE